jgi:hypothetical protein
MSFDVPYWRPPRPQSVWSLTLRLMVSKLFLGSRRFDAKPGILNAECGQVSEFVRQVSGAPPLRVLNLAPLCIFFPVREA